MTYSSFPQVQHEEELGHTVSEVEIEYIQENLVNNFRPVQPLNDRMVYRSFKLSDPQDSHANGDAAASAEMEILKEKLKFYQSRGAASNSAVISLLLLVCSSLLALFL